MHSNGKSVLVAAFAVALLAAPVSAYAAQPRQAKGVSAKMTPVYNADANINARSNTNAAEDFQSHFAIDY
jgi:cytoskeletal protein RodZ